MYDCRHLKYFCLFWCTFTMSPNGFLHLKQKLRCFFKQIRNAFHVISSMHQSILSVLPDERGLSMTQVESGKIAYNAGVRNEDRLLEVNGENVENYTHDEVVEKIKLGGKSVMLLLVDKETDSFYRNQKNKIGSWLATVKFLPLQPRFINMIKGSDGYGFLLRQEPGQEGKANKYPCTFHCREGVVV